jgi:hypothetical protein
LPQQTKDVYCFIVTFEQLKKEAETLSFDEKGRLAAYLIQLRNGENPDYLKEVQRRIHDRERSHW